MLRDAIIGGDFKPGKRLIEEKLAADMATSRTPVREAIQKLEKEGLIFRLPRGGFAVKSVTEDEVEEILGLRSVLEGYAAFLATSRITDAELKQLDEIITREDACLNNLDVDEFIRLDGEFHDVLYKSREKCPPVRPAERSQRLHVSLPGDHTPLSEKASPGRAGP